MEYVAENGGSLLQSHAAVKLNSFNYHSFDVILVLLCSMAVTILLVIKVIRRLWSGFRSATRREKSQIGGNAMNKKDN